MGINGLTEIIDCTAEQGRERSHPPIVKGDGAFPAGFMVVRMVVTVLFLPLAFPQFPLF